MISNFKKVLLGTTLLCLLGSAYTLGRTATLTDNTALLLENTALLQKNTRLLQRSTRLRDKLVHCENSK